MSTSSPERKPLLAILDGHGIIHRAYYALKDTPLVARRTGENTSAVFGFTNTLLTILDDLKPTHLIVAVDLPGPTFRHVRDASYKATRFESIKTNVTNVLKTVPDLQESVRASIAEAVAGAENREQIKDGVYVTADAAGVSEDLRLEIERALSPIESSWELSRQMGRCLEMMEAFNIPVFSAQGYEADDVIGALSVQAAEQGIDTYLVTLDTDLIQLIRDNVTIYMMRPYQRDHVIYTEETATERYKFAPTLMADYKALRGDSSDNIPGIPGVGDGTATKLLSQYPGIDAIYAQLEEIKPDKLRENLRAHEAQVREALDMATIRLDVPDVILDIDEAVVGRYDRQRVLDLLRDLEFRTLVPRLPPVDQAWLGGIDADRATNVVGAVREPPLQQVATTYRLITTEADLDALVERLRAAGRFAFDLEGVGNNPYHTTLVGIAVACAPGEAYYLPVGHRPPQSSLLDARELAAAETDAAGFNPQYNSSDLPVGHRPPQSSMLDAADSPSPPAGRGLGGGVAQLPEDMVLGRLAPLFADETIEKVAHAGKFDLALLTSRGIDTRGFAFDTLLAAYVLGEGALGDTFRAGAGSLSLKWLTSRRLGFEMKEVVDLVGKTGARQRPMDAVSPEDALPYVCENVDYTLRLREPLQREMTDYGEMWKLFLDVEMPLVPVLARMEAAGIALDTSILRELSIGLNEQIDFYEKEAYSAVGHEFNLGSPLQLSVVLFEELGLPKTRKTKQGYTTDAQSIEALRGVHPIIDIILHWRELTKLRSTYIETLPVAVDSRDSRVHTTFDQAVAATGRLSSNNPNLQNIPVRSELGGQVRRAFVARDIGEDPILLSADYSQIELRILAHMSQDPGLIEAFLNDEDIHAATASQVFGVAIEDVTRIQRNRAKVFNFGVLYGLTDFGLAQREGISREEARAFIDRYFDKYQSVRAWRDDIVNSTRADGYAETLAGRRRYIPDIHSSNFNVRQGAERIAINMPIQGTASDIIKIAMIRIDEELAEKGYETKMLLQVHDELIFEGPRTEEPALREMLHRIMPASLSLIVPLKIDIKSGRNWADME